MESSDAGTLLFSWRGCLFRVEAAGLAPVIIASETQSFPRIGYERLDHIRAHDLEATVACGMPETVERFVIQGTAPR